MKYQSLYIFLFLWHLSSSSSKNRFRFGSAIDCFAWSSISLFNDDRNTLFEIYLSKIANDARWHAGFVGARGLIFVRLLHNSLVFSFSLNDRCWIGDIGQAIRQGSRCLGTWHARTFLIPISLNFLIFQSFTVLSRIHIRCWKCVAIHRCWIWHLKFVFVYLFLFVFAINNNQSLCLFWKQDVLIKLRKFITCCSTIYYFVYILQQRNSDRRG